MLPHLQYLSSLLISPPSWRNHYLKRIIWTGISGNLSLYIPVNINWIAALKTGQLKNNLSDHQHGRCQLLGLQDVCYNRIGCFDLSQLWHRSDKNLLIELMNVFRFQRIDTEWEQIVTLIANCSLPSYDFPTLKTSVITGFWFCRLYNSLTIWKQNERNQSENHLYQYNLTDPKLSWRGQS